MLTTPPVSPSHGLRRGSWAQRAGNCMEVITTMKSFVIALLFAPTLATAAVQPWEQEVSHLISYVQSSGCQFKRNEVWHDNAAAVELLNRKYRSLSRSGMASSAEDFIRAAASQSRVTGLTYMVRCQDGNEQPSALWLGAELQRYRATH